jgi:hypothetical protein
VGASRAFAEAGEKPPIFVAVPAICSWAAVDLQDSSARRRSLPLQLAIQQAAPHPWLPGRVGLSQLLYEWV